MSEQWRVNSTETLAKFIDHAEHLFIKHKYVLFSWRVGKDRSLDQNALLHVWIREYTRATIAQIYRSMGEDFDSLSAAEKEGIEAEVKTRLKRAYYCDTAADYMIVKIMNPYTREKETKYRSTKSLKKGEMFDLMTWFQEHAASRGVILEAKGEYKTLKLKQVAV